MREDKEIIMAAPTKLTLEELREMYLSETSTPEQKQYALGELRSLQPDVPLNVVPAPGVDVPKTVMAVDPQSTGRGGISTEEGLKRKYGTPLQTAKPVEQPVLQETSARFSVPVRTGGGTKTAKTTQTTSYGYDPSAVVEKEAETGRQVFEHEKGISTSQAEEIQAAGTEKEKIIQEKRDIINQVIEKNRADVARWSGSPETKKGPMEQIQDRITKSDEILGNIRGEIAKVNERDLIGPGRTIVFALAAAFSGFAAGFRGTGGNPALQMMNSYLDRQMAIKKQQVEKLKDLHNMSKTQRDYLDGVLKDYRKQKEVDILQLTQAQLAENSLKDESVSNKLKTSNSIIELDRRVNKLKYDLQTNQQKDSLKYGEALSPKTTVLTKTSSGGGGGSGLATWMAKEKYKAELKKVGGKVPAGTVSNLVEEYSVAKRAKSLAELVAKTSITPPQEWASIFGTDAGILKPQITAMARQIGRKLGTEKGNFAEREGKVMVDAITGKHWDKAKQTAKRLKELYMEVYNNTDTKIRALKKSGYDVTGLEEETDFRREAPKETTIGDFGSRRR